MYLLVFIVTKFNPRISLYLLSTVEPALKCPDQILFVTNLCATVVPTFLTIVVT